MMRTITQMFALQDYWRFYALNKQDIGDKFYLPTFAIDVSIQ
jgi:hypothetical protein